MTAEPIKNRLYQIIIVPHLQQHPSTISLPLLYQISTVIACAKSLAMLSRTRNISAASYAILPSRTYLPRTATAAFSSSTHRAATPSGPPPTGFRLPPTRRWDQSKESSLDKAGKYFLLAEIMRGMYVVLEQFFRPP